MAVTDVPRRAEERYLEIVEGLKSISNPVLVWF